MVKYTVFNCALVGVGSRVLLTTPRPLLSSSKRQHDRLRGPKSVRPFVASLTASGMALVVPSDDAGVVPGTTHSTADTCSLVALLCIWPSTTRMSAARVPPLLQPRACSASSSASCLGDPCASGNSLQVAQPSYTMGRLSSVASKSVAVRSRLATCSLCDCPAYPAAVPR